MVRGSKQAAQELVDAGLWSETTKGWAFHDWMDYQYTKEEVESRRAHDRERKRRQRDRKLDDDVTAKVTRESRYMSQGESRWNPGEGEGEGKGVSLLVLKNNENEKFEEFWKAYPKKADKAAAKKAWEKAALSVGAETLIDAAIRYRNDPNREDGFTKNAATWLNAGSWENDPLPVRSVGKVTGGETRMKHYENLHERINGQGQIEA